MEWVKKAYNDTAFRLYLFGPDEEESFRKDAEGLPEAEKERREAEAVGKAYDECGFRLLYMPRHEELRQRMDQHLKDPKFPEGNKENCREYLREAASTREATDEELKTWKKAVASAGHVYTGTQGDAHATAWQRVLVS